jgi:NAD(P)-dependent dehydrogenase (short-subunit alcohol dehydrogenase family)
MIPYRAGHIVNISSATASIGVTRLRSIPYTTTKFAIEGFTWTLSVLMQEHGIRVNAIRPSLAITNFHAHSPKEYFAGARCWTPDHIVGPLLETLTEPEGTGQSVDAATWHEARGTADQVSFVHV